MLPSATRSRPQVTAAVLVLVAALAVAGAVGPAAAQNEDAYEAHVEAPDTVKANETFDATLVVSITDPPAEVNLDTELTTTVDGEVVDTRSFNLKTEEGSEVSKTTSVTLSEPGQHEIGFAFTGVFIGNTMVDDERSATVTVVSNVSTRVGDVSQGGSANVSLDPGSADIALSYLELFGAESVDDVFVQIQPSSEAPDGAPSGPENARRYFTIDPVTADASSFSETRVAVFVREGTFLPGATVDLHYAENGSWTSLDPVKEEVEDGAEYSTLMPSMGPIAVTASGGQEPSNGTEEAAGEDDDDAGADDGGGMPGFGAGVAAVAVLAAVVAVTARRRG